ncbi:MAG: hypothetical protein IJ762_10700 [Bacteroidaceae bacterium]|nr:hypothetical protein [Bacteroidaceae bacterium]
MININRTNLNGMIDSTWRDFQNVRSMPRLVKDSIPILWFGDIDAYEKSDRQIVTVGLNPSKMEFEEVPNKGVDVRFSKASSLVGKNTLSSADCAVYASAMNEYFSNNPYDRWFRRYEFLLKQLDSSYYKDGDYSSVHIDICSPVATDPTWGGLCANSTSVLMKKNTFSTLLNILNPQIILVSANKDLVESDFGANGWNTHAIKKNAYVRSKRFNGRIVIWGYNFRGTPFGGMTDIELKKTFNDIKKYYNLNSNIQKTKKHP